MDSTKTHVALAMKSGFEDRWPAYNGAIELGVLTPQEVREIELIQHPNLERATHGPD